MTSEIHVAGSEELRNNKQLWKLCLISYIEN